MVKQRRIKRRKQGPKIPVWMKIRRGPMTLRRRLRMAKRREIDDELYAVNLFYAYLRPNPMLIARLGS
jgi:hypothetical protein